MDYINTINKPTGNDNRHLSDKIMTRYTRIRKVGEWGMTNINIGKVIREDLEVLGVGRVINK